MALFRTFVAFEVSPQVQAGAAELSDRLRESGAKVSWTKPGNLHLTLKFLGDTPDAKIPDVCRAMTRAAAEVEPIEATFREVGAFPRDARPRTVWLGVDRGREALCRLQAEFEEQMYQVGFPRERRRFVPHLTLGRVRAGGPTQLELGRLIQANADFAAGHSTLDEMLAIASFLDPEGPTYQVLGRSRLRSD